jgi:hypothetical protein
MKKQRVEAGDGAGTAAGVEGTGARDERRPVGGNPEGIEQADAPGERARGEPLPAGGGDGRDGAGHGPDAVRPSPDQPPIGDAVFRDIVRKAAEGNIKYQELYLRYIDLISGRQADADEVIYEATFVDDKDQET